MKIWVIEDEKGWIDYYSLIFQKERLSFFTNGVDAMQAMSRGLPDVVILDMLLVGPSGVAVLHEMQSYVDSAAILVIVVSSVEILDDLSGYGVVGVLDKGKMRPEELMELVWTYGQRR